MTASLAPLLKEWRWPVLAMLASAIMLGAAHAFENFGRMLPCPLCLRQREVYWAVAAMSLTALVLNWLRPNPRFFTAINVMLGLVFLTGAIVAFFHAGVEYGIFTAPTGCITGAIDPAVWDLGNINAPQDFVSCQDDPLGGQYGLSMAGWNGVVSTIFSGVSFLAASLTGRNQQQGDLTLA